MRRGGIVLRRRAQRVTFLRFVYIFPPSLGDSNLVEMALFQPLSYWEFTLLHTPKRFRLKIFFISNLLFVLYLRYFHALMQFNQMSTVGQDRLRRQFRDSQGH